MAPPDDRHSTPKQEVAFEAQDTQVDISLSGDVEAVGQPAFRIHLRGNMISDLTPIAYPVPLPVREVIVLLNEQSGQMEEVVLVGPKGGYHLRDNPIGVSGQYSGETGDTDNHVRYIVLKPSFRPSDGR